MIALNSRIFISCRYIKQGKFPRLFDMILEKKNITRELTRTQLLLLYNIEKYLH